jgi:hypothetical protein
MSCLNRVTWLVRLKKPACQHLAVMITAVEMVAMHGLSIAACLLLDDGMHVGDAVTATV